MEQTPIAQLSPELPSVESQHFRATVTLIWPYSSSARQLALLLVEPDVKLRRRNGQVRARFSGASAKAIATAGVGIGDEVVLSLRGAQFVTEGVISTPGKSIDWELEYSQTVVIRIFRNGEETANVELVDAPPTPAPMSPLHRQSRVAPSPALQYSSPAFLKRARLSDGPFFEAPYDPLADETGEGHDKKRRRKSYRDWKAWTYSARTPSPEKEDTTMDDTTMDDELEWLEASPSRAAQLPQTPTSPSKPANAPAPAEPQHVQGTEPTETEASAGKAALSSDEQQARKSPVRDSDYGVVYSGPDEQLASDAQYAFGGDTEVDTEVNTEEEYPTQGETEEANTSTAEPGAHETHRMEREVTGIEDDAASEARIEEGTSMDHVQVVEPHEATKVVSDIDADDQAADRSPASLLHAPRIAMPPPTLSTIQSDIQSTATVGLLTPIGREPGSPTLRPLDSANLPIPSPFPGERENTATSYFDHLVTNMQTVETEPEAEDEQNPPSEASYIGETSFFSSIGSSKASAFHPNHESAFTPVRFTFGMDGAWVSRPMELSSPPPEAQAGDEHEKAPEPSASSTVVDTSFDASDMGVIPASQSAGDVETASQQAKEESTTDARNTVEEPQQHDVTMLSSDEEDGSSDEESDQNTADHMAEIHADKEAEDGAAVDPVQHSTDDKTVNESRSMTPRSHSEFVNLDLAAETPTTSEVQNESVLTHTPSQEPEPSEDVDPMEQSFSVDHSYEATMEATDEYLQDAFPIEHMSQEFQDEEYAQPEQDFLVKEQSIEDQLSSQTNPSNTPMAAELPDQSANKLSMIATEQGHDGDEAQTVDAPPTAPAKNTRSKAKAQTPSKTDEAPASVRTTRSTRSRGSVSSIARSVMSPPRTRTRSAKSPSQSGTQASPVSVRTQSGFLSPEKSASVTAATTVHESPRKALQRRLNQEFAAVRSQTEVHDSSSMHPELSEEQGASQAKYLNDVFVKDWAEGNIRTRYSTSPAHASGELNEMQKSESSSPVKRGTLSKEEEIDTEPGSDVEQKSKTKSRAKAERKKLAPKAIVETQSSQNVPSESGTPSRRLRSKGPIESVTQTPRSVRRTRRNVYNVSEPKGTEDISENDPKTNEESDKVPPQSEGERGAQTLDTHPDRALDAQAVLPRQRLMTPDATQQTTMESQSSSVVAPTEQNLLTPQPTQATSTNLHTSQKDVDMDVTAVSPGAKKSANIKTSPQHNKTATDVTSPSLSPTLIEDPPSKPSPDDTAEQPSVGLSTPLAYYTPLKDLLYFLNRSSQFHSAANPDILALVTSATTVSEKAKKGPKHWNTTLHITDASSWPATTTVQCFRAYQEALPEATIGDVILLRAFAVKSLNRHPTLVSADESAWCVWRWGKPVWGANKGPFGELKAREEVKGPEVERGEGEWREVERLRSWYVDKVKQELQEKEASQVKTRSRDKAKGAAGGSGGA
jgi:hypothetical protein